MIAMTVVNLDEFKQAVRERGESALTAFRAATVKGAEQVAASVKSRIKIPPHVNVQDSPNYISLNQLPPVEVRTDPRSGTGYVQVDSYWAYARSRPVTNVYSRVGKGDELVRDGLWIQRSGRKSRGHKSRSGLRFLSLSSSSRFQEWAESHDVIRRDAVKIEDGRVLEALVLGPAVNESEPKLLRIYTNAVEEGLG